MLISLTIHKQKITTNFIYIYIYIHTHTHTHTYTYVATTDLTLGLNLYGVTLSGYLLMLLYHHQHYCNLLDIYIYTHRVIHDLWTLLQEVIS